jgi:hypothetical protein
MGRTEKIAGIERMEKMGKAAIEDSGGLKGGRKSGGFEWGRRKVVRQCEKKKRNVHGFRSEKVVDQKILA